MSGEEGSVETIGQRLRRLRLERGLSQRELAAPGVSYAYISRIEAGTRQPSVKALRRLAAKLGVSPDYLETGRDVDAADARELRLADAELALRLGDASVAEQTIADILVESVGAGDVANANRARTALGFVHYERGDHKVAVRLFEEVLAAAAHQVPDLLEVHITLARAYSSAGVPERAVDLLQACLAELRSTDPYDVAVEVRYANALSYALSDSGDLARAGEVLNEALDRARESGDDPYMRVRLYWSLARLAEMEGKAGMALHHLRRAIALLEATDDTLHLARAYLSAAVVMIAQGNAEASLAQLDQAEQLFGPQISRDDAAMVARERSRALVILGRGEEALAKAREAVALFDGRNEPELGSAQSALADALTLRHEYEEADTAFALAVTALVEQTRWREAAQTCQAWARMLRKTGRETEALDVLERAAELGMRLAPAQSLER